MLVEKKENQLEIELVMIDSLTKKSFTAEDKRIY
jgi:hypothetical protein